MYPVGAGSHARPQIGGIYVKGIHVGKIKKVNAGSNKTDSYAIIETAVDFEKLETVLVITQ